MAILYRCLFVYLVGVWGLLENVHGKRTGFKARITSNGINYANKVAMDILAAKIRTFRVPDQHGESDDVEYDLTNLRVTGFSEPGGNIVFLPGTGLRWAANGAGISMNGDFHYKISKGWLPDIRGSGSFDISVYGLDFSINMNLGVDPDGRPSIAATGCSCEISGVSIDFHGGWAWLYNLFSGLLEDNVRSTLRGKICNSVTNQINEDGEKKLAALQVTTKLGPKFLLDYRLIQAPSFQSSYMETFHEGEIFWLGDKTDAPFEPPAMADIGDTQKMMYLWVSDYTFNTLGYAAQMHNYLVRNITAADLPPDRRGILNTTCTSFACLGNLIPQLQKTYPNSTVELDLFSGSPPTMTITPEDLRVLCSGKIVLYARQRNNNLAYLMTLFATMETTADVSIANELVYAKIDDMKLQLNVTDSAIGPFDSRFLQMLINNVLKVSLIPKINELGQKGFPLPVTGKIRFVNTSLRLVQHAVVIETDLNYIG